MVAIKDRPVQYLDELSGQYREERQAAQSLRGLWEAIARWEPVAGDAFDVVSKMTADDYEEYERGEALERRGKFAGDEWAARFGAILLPEMLIRTSIIASQFHVPEGCAFIRAVEVGRFKKRNGRFYDALVEADAAATSRQGGT